MIDLIEQTLKKRYNREKRFKFFGFLSIIFAISFLAIFLSIIYIKGNKAFFNHKILLKVDFSTKNIIKYSDLTNNFDQLSQDQLLEQISYRSLIKDAINNNFSKKSQSEINSINKLISENSEFILRDILAQNFDYLNSQQEVWLDLSSKADIYLKYDIKEPLTIKQISLIKELVDNSKIDSFFNSNFFFMADSREAESAGIAASLIGSFLVMIVFLLFAFPIGVMCAFYLEEFAPKNKATDLIEISINNLAAIPSIIYGLLGLTLYLQIMSLPRSSALVGGMTLFMLVLPVVIIATRNTIRTIPQSIRDAAIGLGASKMQVVLHHLLPLSTPGIMTGTILAMSRALGETAPLLMIGMIAFIADIPSNILEPTTVLPVQIFLWSDSPEIGFAEKTSAAIMILLSFLILFNLIAIVIRKKFERKW